MMMDDREKMGDIPPEFTQISDEAASSDDSANSTVPCVHNVADTSDSLNNHTENAEEFLRRQIDAAQAEVDDNLALNDRSHPADAALIGFVKTYLAAHLSPPKFLRKLTEALRDFEAMPPTKE